ncbi:hypothetical protein PPL_07055 [Heterostelium album PN500]|uniref:Uncharacterized protein n=1 Tax=Heterostelium pallidum (strain ATCC 26659 / Pp 5 / PN500) TaxID=670386 RepID=D3BE99_HETP5|nr:hypothetical protein PPL_07055 [Heterostelium album PN500]EFA80230.1 hypothetical protein PPL_07055 [Heterostelium album PN500]|eukprot:XP_020432350.1 hypothetical protein PPL_07055 [Heterostelium album PN500]
MSMNFIRLTKDEIYHNKMVTKGLRVEMYQTFDVSRFTLDQIRRGKPIDVYTNTPLAKNHSKKIRDHIHYTDFTSICFNSYIDNNQKTNSVRFNNKTFKARSAIEVFDIIANMVKSSVRPKKDKVDQKINKQIIICDMDKS